VKNPQSTSAKEDEVLAITAGGILIYLEETPFKDRRPINRAVYEDVEHEMWGVGVAENNEPDQMVLNASIRLFFETKAMALLPPMTIDRDVFLPSENFKLSPGKQFHFKPGTTPDQKKNALLFHLIPDVSDGWKDVITLVQELSDDDTAINKYTQGNDSRNLNKTARGISMIMNVSNLPLKEVMGNIDSMWIEPCIQALIDWNMENLEPETVQLVHGDEIAAMWKDIKRFGKTSFMEWSPTGSSTMMAKEVLLQKWHSFLQKKLSENISDLTEDL